MKAEDQSRQRQQESEPIFAHIAKWREEHPHATMAEIEQAVDEQMQSLRTQVLQEAGPLEEQSTSSASNRERYPECHVPMQARGQRSRRLQTQGGQ